MPCIIYTQTFSLEDPKELVTMCVISVNIYLIRNCLEKKIIYNCVYTTVINLFKCNINKIFLKRKHFPKLKTSIVRTRACFYIWGKLYFLAS